MEEIKKALNQMGADVGGAIQQLRDDMKKEFDAQQRGIDAQQRAIEAQQRAIEAQQRAIATQSHILDQGLAQVNESFERHRENIAKVVFAFVEDLNALKADMRSVKTRVEALEKRAS